MATFQYLHETRRLAHTWRYALFHNTRRAPLSSGDAAPSAKDLKPLLSSKHLSNSLLIIATHEPPAIPHTALPTIRILRLKAPLAIEQSGAVRFVNVLEWAERVARLWRKYGGYGAAELSEDSDGQDYLPPPLTVASQELSEHSCVAGLVVWRPDFNPRFCQFNPWL